MPRRKSQQVTQMTLVYYPGSLSRFTLKRSGVLKLPNAGWLCAGPIHRTIVPAARPLLSPRASQPLPPLPRVWTFHPGGVVRAAGFESAWARAEPTGVRSRAPACGHTTGAPGAMSRPKPRFDWAGRAPDHPAPSRGHRAIAAMFPEA